MEFITNTLPAKQLHLHMNAIAQLNQVLEYLKNTFVGKDEIIDLLGICLVARENAFFLVLRHGQKCYCSRPITMYCRRK
jgi:hypothetical protein